MCYYKCQYHCEIRFSYLGREPECTLLVVTPAMPYNHTLRFLTNSPKTVVWKNSNLCTIAVKKAVCSYTYTAVILWLVDLRYLKRAVNRSIAECCPEALFKWLDASLQALEQTMLNCCEWIV